MGVVENMAGFVCPCCSTKSDVFPAITGGAEQMAKEMNVPFLGSIPLDPGMLRACEKGMGHVAWLEAEKQDVAKASALPPFVAFVDKLMDATSALQTTFSATSEQVDDVEMK